MKSSANWVKIQQPHMTKKRTADKMEALDKRIEVLEKDLQDTVPLHRSIVKKLMKENEELKKELEWVRQQERSATIRLEAIKDRADRAWTRHEVKKQGDHTHATSPLAPPHHDGWDDEDDGWASV